MSEALAMRSEAQTRGGSAAEARALREDAQAHPEFKIPAAGKLDPHLILETRLLHFYQLTPSRTC